MGLGELGLASGCYTCLVACSGIPLSTGMPDNCPAVVLEGELRLIFCPEATQLSKSVGDFITYSVTKPPKPKA